MKYDINRLDERRIMLGWTRQKLAHIAGINHGTLTRILQGHIAKPATWKSLAEAVGLKMEDICKPDSIDETVETKNEDSPTSL